MDQWHLNNKKVILALWTMNYGDCVSFFYWFFSTNLKKSYSQISRKTWWNLYQFDWSIS